VRQPDASADKLRTGKTNGIRPHLFQKLADVTRLGQRRIAGFLARQRLETLGEGVPQRGDIGQALLARVGGFADAELARRAAVVQQQVADSRTNVKAHRAEIPELGVDSLQAAVGDKNRAAVNIAVIRRLPSW